MEEQQDIYQALSDPSRRKILSLLSQKELSAGEIAQQFEMSWPSVSRHLGVLKAAGLVTSTREGQNVHYALERSVLAQVGDDLAAVAGSAPGAQDDERYVLFERFNEQARRAIGYAQEEARDLGHASVAPEHLLLGIIGVDEGVGARALDALGVRADLVRTKIRELMPAEERPSGPLAFASESRLVLEHALRQTIRLGHSYVGTGPMLLAILSLGGFGRLGEMLKEQGVDAARLRDEVLQRMRGYAEGPGAPLGRTAGLFENFTQRARRVVMDAQEQARELRHNYIGTEHLLLGILQDESSAASQALLGLGVVSDAVCRHVIETIGRGSEITKSASIPFTPRSKKVLELALAQAAALGQPGIGPEHILLALLEEGEGVAPQVLTQKLGLDADAIRQAVLQTILTREPTAEDAPLGRPDATTTLSNRLDSLERLVRTSLSQIQTTLRDMQDRLGPADRPP